MGIHGPRAAIRLLTVLPLPGRRDPGAMGRAAPFFPLAGLVVGGAAAAAALLTNGLQPALAGALILAAWAGATGILHLDGLADTADAALAPRTPAERREIARDPRVGSFGLVAVVLVLLVKAGALGGMVEFARRTGGGGASGPGAVLPLWSVLLVVPIAARSFLVPMMAVVPPYPGSRMGAAARPGTGAAIGAGAVGLALAAAAVVAALLLDGGGPGTTVVDLLAPDRWRAAAATLVAPVLAGLAVMALGAGWFARRLGGLGGDPCGALVELGEAAMLVGLAA